MLDIDGITKLNKWSPTVEVLECLINALDQQTDDEFIYDDEENTVISFEDAREVLAQLRDAHK